MRLRLPHLLSCGILFVLPFAGSVSAAAAPPAVARAGSPEAAYTVKPGDILSISVWKEPDLSGPAAPGGGPPGVLVRPDGMFSFPLAGQMDARGKTVQELQQMLTEKLRKYISDPVVTVSIQEIKGNKVYVIGQVNKPGDFVVNPKVDVMQALSMAGGTTPFAALGDIMILRRTDTGQQQALPFRYTDVVRGKNLDQNITLQAGDVVVVP
ncbi:MAG TPA: polysaccharide biosynthesis/export family protein [Steroidobacteraceae bacterium]|nr:polysaccharide biosynthesis/export family protein [Steroidobacteraceae bacterium]